MQKKIKLFLIGIVILVIVFLLYKRYMKSSFGFGAEGDYLWPDPANGNTLYSQQPISPSTGNIIGIPRGLPYTLGSLTCYNAIPKTGWSSSSSVQAVQSTPLNNPGATSTSANNELEMFQNFMNYQPNIKAFMSNETQLFPVLVVSSGSKLLDGTPTYKVDNSALGTSIINLFNDLVAANGGPVTVGTVNISKDLGYGGTIKQATSSTSSTLSPYRRISLNAAVSIPKLSKTDPKYNAYMTARMYIIVGILNALHFIYSPALLVPESTPGNYVSVSKSAASIKKDPTKGYEATSSGGNTTANQYVGIIQELYNNYPIDQPVGATTVTVKEYRTDVYSGITLALTPNAKHAVWVYLYARDKWIEQQLEGFLNPNGSTKNLEQL
jgi:hypothetical protein